MLIFIPICIMYYSKFAPNFVVSKCFKQLSSLQRSLSPHCGTAAPRTKQMDPAVKFQIQSPESSLLFSFLVSVCIPPRYSMIYNHLSVCLHQHPSLFMDFHGRSTEQQDCGREKDSLSVRGQKEVYSAQFFFFF